MRPHWNRDHDRNVAAQNDWLRRRYEDRREDIQTDPVRIPHQLNQAIYGPRWSGEPVLVTANGRDVAAVLGTESTDAQAIWRDISAAVQADEDSGTGVRLIPPAPLADGLRAVAVPSEQQVVVWQTSAESVTNRQRRIAARRALGALRGGRGPKIPPGVQLTLLVPGWRKAVPIAAVATAAVVVAVLISTGQVLHPNPQPPSPAVAATPQVTASTSHSATPSAPSSSPVRSRRSGRSGSPAAGGAAPSRHNGTRTLSSEPAPSARRTPAPSTSSSRSPSPQPTVKKKVCAVSVLGVCLSWK